jgi:hypothetical protein
VGPGGRYDEYIVGGAAFYIEYQGNLYYPGFPILVK